jgi:S1-C subfamily serine protease
MAAGGPRGKLSFERQETDTMAVDFTVQMITATVNLEQRLDGDLKRTGSAFLVSAPDASGQPQTVMVTARHLMAAMPKAPARLGLRFQTPEGGWRLRWHTVQVRSGDRPLWVQHPTQDVAVISVQVPDEIARAAIPLSWLADADTFARQDVGPGDEMVTLGYPGGYSANKLGFPILRAGRIASYPLTPIRDFPTFTLDFTVMPGHSGGPVFMPEDARRRSGLGGETRPFVAGLLSQSSESLDLGFVTHAQFVREAIDQLNAAGAIPQPVTEGAP